VYFPFHKNKKAESPFVPRQPGHPEYSGPVAFRLPIAQDLALSGNKKAPKEEEKTLRGFKNAF
jgi:hypothetical protein